MPNELPKLLITGVSGFLGSHFLSIFSEEWNLIGTFHQNAVRSNQVATYPLDLQNSSEVNLFLQKHQPQAILHLAAMSNANYCEQDPTTSFVVNVQSSLDMAQFCADEKIPFLFASTDLVFDGQQAPYSESDPTDPVNIYGKHKVIAEQNILKTYPRAIIARLPLMFGHSNSAPNFMTAWLSQLREGKIIKAFTDEYRTAAAAHEVIGGLLLLLRKKVSGIWHLGGAERMSRYDFALKMANYYNLNPNLIEASRQKEVKMAAGRPADVSLNSDKAFALGYQVSKLEVALDKITVS